MNRRLWFLVHGWCSLPVWLVFCFVCLTGTVAVISHELTWLTNPAARVANPDHLPRQPVSALIAAVETEVPGAAVSSVMWLEPYLVSAVSFTTAGAPPATAYVNPYTAEVQMVNTGMSFIEFMRGLHGWLLFPWHHNYSVGYYLVCAMAVVMLAALVTGLVIYKQFWRALLRPQVRRDKGSRTFIGDLHRTTGVWSLWFLLLMSATGLWYLTQAIFWHNDIDIWPESPLLASSQLPRADASGNLPAPAIAVDEAVALARQTFTDFTPALVQLPEHNRDTYKVAGAGANVLFDHYAYGLAVNPWTGRIEEQREPARMNTLQALTHIADPLHYGTIGGLWTKVIWFGFGLLLTGMSIMGFMIWSLRTRAGGRRQRQPRRAPASHRSGAPQSTAVNTPHMNDPLTAGD